MHWQFWFLSGVRGQYIDIDFNLLFFRGFLHLRYGDERLCDNPNHG